MIDYHGDLGDGDGGGSWPESHEIHRGGGRKEYRGIGGKMVNIRRDGPISSAAAHESYI